MGGLISGPSNRTVLFFNRIVVNLPTENSSEQIDSLAGSSKKNSMNSNSLGAAAEVSSRLRSSKIYWIFGGVIIVLVFLVIALGAKLHSMAKQLDVLESKSSAVLSTTQVLKDSGTVESAERFGLTQAELAKVMPIADQISTLIAKISGLPFNPQPLSQNPVKPNAQPPSQKQQAPAANAEIKWWRQVRDRFWMPIRNFFHDLVKIQVIDTDSNAVDENIALTPAAQLLLRQEVRLQLLSARQLLLVGLSRQASMDIARAQVLISKNFAAQSKSVEQFMDDLEKIEMQLKSNSVSVPAASSAGKK